MVEDRSWEKEGEKALEMGNFTDAAHFFRKALEERPYEAYLYSRLGISLWRNGVKREALENITRALELDSNNRKVISDCVVVFRDLGREDDAREIIEAYLERNPWDRDFFYNSDDKPSSNNGFDPAEFLISEGEKQYEKGNKEKARVCFELALEREPGSAKACNNLGVLAWEKGSLEEALEWFYKALELDSNDPQVILNSSRVLVEVGELELAGNLMEIYLSKCPGDQDAWKQYKFIIKEISSPWRPEGLNGKVADIYVKMGKELIDAGDFHGGIEAFGRASLLAPESPEPLYQLARLHLRLGQNSEALEMLREAVNKDPFHRESVLVLASILMDQNLGEEARMILERYLDRYHDEEIAALLGEAGDGKLTADQFRVEKES